MHNITLVCTRHRENGKCNSHELLRIIEEIKPEVIFEELSKMNFYKVYEWWTLKTLESDAIKDYAKTNQFFHEPVDTFPLPKNYEAERDYMLDRIFTADSIPESITLRKKIDTREKMEGEQGFDILNSDENDKYIEELFSPKEKVLRSLKDDHLFRLFDLGKEIVAKREQAIIKNIYNFSKDHEYNNGLMFIGAAHRRAIMKLIEETNNQEELKLNWNYYRPPTI